VGTSVHARRHRKAAAARLSSTPALTSGFFRLSVGTSLTGSGCSYRDAGYLALADLLGCPFVHADDKLRDKLAGRFPHEVWIEDYRPAAV
jgi:predicted nucleic acid-binding protein